LHLSPFFPALMPGAAGIDILAPPGPGEHHPFE
jgi:hypothetical protein